jgi:hypothetical protein
MTEKSLRKPATFAALVGKPPRTKELILKVPDVDGTVVEHVMVLRAIGSKAYDTLVGMHPPTPEQKKDGAGYNPDTFGPALISACSLEPYLTPNEAKELWNSEQWSRGEVMDIFSTAVEVCSKGLDVPFTEPASDTTPPSP